MTTSTPLSLREHAVELSQHGKPVAEIAVFLNVHRSTVYRWIERHKKNGHIEFKKPGKPRKRALDAAGEKRLCELIDEKPDRTIDQLTTLLHAEGFMASRSVVDQRTRSLGYTYKKSQAGLRTRSA